MIPVRGFEGKRVAVFGLGRTGLTAARALIAGGAQVALWDEAPAARDAAALERLPLVDLRAADYLQAKLAGANGICLKLRAGDRS